MDFTYNAYRNLIFKLQENGYYFADYHNWEGHNKVAILRHDIDYSMEKAVEMAKLETALGVKSTYFVLVTGDFYNVFSASMRKYLMAIKEMGHHIGLHFDETGYGSDIDIIENIKCELELLSKIIGERVLAVSMHRPSEKTLKADWNICDGLVANSYSRNFFQEFKYLSDSRRHWRENMDDINVDEYPKLQILIHAFWYHEEDWSLQKTIETFINDSVLDRYDKLDRNFTDLQSVVVRDWFL